MPRLKGVRAERGTPKPGGILGERCVCLDGGRLGLKANADARVKPVMNRRRGSALVRVMPTPACPALDERVPGLLLDVLAPIEAAIASAATGVPYVAMRAAMNIDEGRRDELLRAARQVAAAHSDWFAKHRSGIEFVIGLTAISAARVDVLLTFADAQQAGAGLEPKPCSTHQAVVIGLIVLVPVLLAAVFVLYKFIKEGNPNGK